MFFELVCVKKNSFKTIVKALFLEQEYIFMRIYRQYIQTNIINTER